MQRKPAPHTVDVTLGLGVLVQRRGAEQQCGKITAQLDFLGLVDLAQRIADLLGGFDAVDHIADRPELGAGGRRGERAGGKDGEQLSEKSPWAGHHLVPFPPR